MKRLISLTIVGLFIFGGCAAVMDIIPIKDLQTNIVITERNIVPEKEKLTLVMLKRSVFTTTSYYEQKEHVEQAIEKFGITKYNVVDELESSVEKCEYILTIEFETFLAKKSESGVNIYINENIELMDCKKRSVLVKATGSTQGWVNGPYNLHEIAGNLHPIILESIYSDTEVGKRKVIK